VPATSKAVFVSYASQDSAAALSICEGLRAGNIDVWFDQDELRGGDDWDRKIRRQIRECALFIPVISENASARTEGYFRLEWNLADQRAQRMARTKPFILPVLIDHVSRTQADVPDSFERVQWTRLPEGKMSPDFVQHVAGLITSDGSDWYRTLLSVTSGATGASMSLDDPIPQRSIAVLPFIDLSPERSQEYFSEGLAEELISLLTQVRDLRVPGRTSSFSFKGKSETISGIARTLRVAHVLEGSVRKAGNVIRVTVRLVRAVDGYHLWSQSFERGLEDIFQVQEDIARTVVEALRGELLQDRHVVSHHRTASPDAYDAYLQAKQLFNARTVEALREAVSCLQRAIGLDPNYAPGYVLLALTEFALLELGSAQAESVAQILAAADDAVRLAPRLSEAYSARGYVRFRIRWDWSGASADLARAVRLDAHDSGTQARFAFVLAALGQYSEGIEAASFATDANPLDAVNWTMLGVCLEGACQFESAARAFRHALEISPSANIPIMNLVLVTVSLKRLSEARDVNDRQPNEAWRWTGQAIIEHALGHTEESRRLLDDLMGKYGKVMPYAVGGVYAWREEPDQAFEWFERAFSQRDPSLCMIKIHARPNSMTRDPRYQRLLQRMNLPPVGPTSQG
jgi:TolB-like protein/Tfp pilus assembly protein PilF